MKEVIKTLLSRCRVTYSSVLNNKTESPAHATPASFAELPKAQRVLLTVRQFSKLYPAFSEASLRWQIFQSRPRRTSKGVIPGNGLADALARAGRRVLIDEAKFLEWVHKGHDEQRGGRP